jgi:hypothetical protein
MMMRIASLALWLSTLAAATQVVPPPPEVPSGSGPLGAGGLRLPDSSFFTNPSWNDGLAEVSRYDLVQFRYGRLHPGSVTMVTVREGLDPTRVVKSAKPGPDDIPALKTHLVKSFQTGVYRYEQAVTVLFRRVDGIPLRLFVSSHEWCGSTGKSWVNNGAGSELRVMSYFDGHGDMRQPLELPADGVLEDSLPTWLRALDLAAMLDSSVQVRCSLVPTQLEARAQDTHPLPCAVRVLRRAVFDLPAGAFDAIEVEVAALEPTPLALATAAIERAPPHRLLSYRHRDGTTLTLLDSSRTDYWNHHFPEDAPASR